MNRQRFALASYAAVWLGTAVVWAPLPAAAPAWAEGPFGPSYSRTSGRSEAALPRREPLPRSAFRDPAAAIGQPPTEVRRPHPNRRSSLPSGSKGSPFGPPATSPFASWQGLDRLPRTEASTHTRGPVVPPVRPPGQMPTRDKSGARQDRHTRLENPTQREPPASWRRSG